MEQVLGYKMLSGYAYDTLKHEFQNMYSSNLTTTIVDTCKKFDNDKKEFVLGNKSVACFGKDQPIDLHGKTFEFTYDNDTQDWNADIKLFSLKFKKEHDLNQTSLKFALKVDNNNQKAILERCLSKDYKQSASKLIWNKNKGMWFLYLSYSFENTKCLELKDENIMGIDLGINIPIYASFNNSTDKYYIDKRDIDQFRIKFEMRRRSMQRHNKYSGEGSNGHGYNTKLKSVNLLGDKIARFRDTKNHQYSKAIVDEAIKHGCKTIQMENLTGISSYNKFLRNWSYYDLQTKIEYKAKQVGIEVKYINPKYTSQRCSSCGYIHNNNRPKGEKGQAYFKCIQCGFETNADYNASQNIAVRDIEYIIADYIKNNKEDFLKK